MLFCNLGVYHDLIYILTEYFKGETKIQWLDMSEVPEGARIFFYKKAKGVSFMQQLLCESYGELLHGGGIQVIQNKIIDSNKTVKRITEFYFGKGEPDCLVDDSRFIKEINKEIVKSKYSTEIKSALYAFFIEPFKNINELMRTFLEIDMQLNKMYENRRSSILKVQSGINSSEMLQNLNLSTDNTVVTICLLDDKCADIVSLDDRTVVFLGVNYKKNIEAFCEVNLKEFGYILTEENRLKILNLMRLKGEITIKDVEQLLEFSGTNAYYHLSLMTKSGMVVTRYEGRTVFYRISNSYIEKVFLEISKYCR